MTQAVKIATPFRRVRLLLGTHPTVPAAAACCTPCGALSSGFMEESSAGAASAAELASPLSFRIDELWEYRSRLTPDDASARAEVTAAIGQLDSGEARVAW